MGDEGCGAWGGGDLTMGIRDPRITPELTNCDG